MQTVLENPCKVETVFISPLSTPGPQDQGSSKP